jgi:UDP-N-acetylmuramate dehydrogenase
MALHIREHVPLRDFTTFRIGGPARFFCEVSSEAELREAVLFARTYVGWHAGSPVDGQFFILGGGSNVLIDDAGFDGLVIHMKIQLYEKIVQLNPVDTEGTENKENLAHFVRVTAGAGENWDDFVKKCVTDNLAGLEQLSLIPGTVGGAVVQNIGAYGVEVKDTVHSVRAFDTETLEFVDFTNKDCHFLYRESFFKKNKKYIVTSAIFNLKHSEESGKSADQLHADREAVISIRLGKLPDIRPASDEFGKIGTAGSFFKNPTISAELYEQLHTYYPKLPGYPENPDLGSDSPVKIPLAWILDNVCGYKGITKGSVGTYKSQALVIVNHFHQTEQGLIGATADDVKIFAKEIARTVLEKTGIEIEPEVVFI